MPKLARVVLDFLTSILLYLSVVIGGITLFLILAPLFGYLPYSDRPGPGWFAAFPALTWSQFWANTLAMLEFGLFFGVLFILAGGLCVLSVRLLERVVRRTAVVRVAGGVISALVSGYWMLGAGWYIAAGVPLLALSVVLGAIAGGWVLPRTSVGLTLP